MDEVIVKIEKDLKKFNDAYEKSAKDLNDQDKIPNIR